MKAEKMTSDLPQDKTSQAESILDKVTKALVAKKTTNTEQEDDVLELTEVANEGDGASQPQDTKDSQQKPNNISVIPTNLSQEKNMSEKIVSEDAAEATAALFHQLKTAAKSKADSESLKFRSGTTVEEVVAELVRPHLSEWLDKNLPAIVKSCVEKEVKKLIPTEE
ncbi:MAG: DUF2497 domain-containing protein [Rickettsiaceae bacterium]|nr:DUF2497 domain-containing protein [Rickettsiaceae bacterium]